MSYIWYKTELQLTDFQKEIIDYGIKLQRDMWNYLVEYKNIEVDNKTLNIFASDKQLIDELFDVFYNEFKQSGLGTRMIRSVVKRYVKAWANCFNSNMETHRAPIFHSYKKSIQSLTFSGIGGNIIDNCYQLPIYNKTTFGVPNHIKQKQVKLKVIEDVAKYLSKYEKLEPKNSTIIRRKNRYFLCMNYECIHNECVTLDGEIGLDWGLVDYFVDSNGNRYNIPKSAERQLQRIKSLQRVLSKKTKGSKNYEKVVEKINDAWFRYNSIKKDYVEKLTLNLCRNNKLIAIENLNLIEMRSKTHKSRRRQINHNSFSMFKMSLTRKQERFKNCSVVLINRWFPSSQLCSNCGENTGKKPVSIRDFTCPYCGTHLDRDTNAAINILIEGKREFAEKRARQNAAKG